MSTDSCRTYPVVAFFCITSRYVHTESVVDTFRITCKTIDRTGLLYASKKHAQLRCYFSSTIQAIWEAPLFQMSQIFGPMLSFVFTSKSQIPRSPLSTTTLGISALLISCVAETTFDTTTLCPLLAFPSQC